MSCDCTVNLQMSLEDFAIRTENAGKCEVCGDKQGMTWVSLHTHSTFSYGDGYGPVAYHVDTVADLGMQALALAEHGNSSSWVQLEKHCARRGIKPIFGLEAYIAPENVPRKCHMILLASNEIGLRNLNRLITASWKTLGSTSKSKFPTIHPTWFKGNVDGIIALSGCADSEISCRLLGGKSFGDKRLEPELRHIQSARAAIERYQEIFEGRYYLEVQRFPGLPRTCQLNPAYENLSAATGAPLVATADVHYPNPDENKMQRILHAAHRGGTVESVDAEWEYDILLTYPRTDHEIIRDLMATGLTSEGAHAAVFNTAEIAQRCSVTLPKAPPPAYIIDPQRDWKEWQ